MNVEIWSDVVCPWCYVGKRRFETALAAFEHRDETNVVWRSFELDPSAPAIREADAASHLARKYGRSRDDALRMHEQMTALAAAEGLEMRFDIARGGNTFDAHRLIQLAGEHGLAEQMTERLFRAYFTDGEPIGERETLTRIGAESGLPEAELRELFLTERLAEEVRDDERTAASLGITAVPCFVVDRRMGISGAQDPAILGKLLRKGWEARAESSRSGSTASTSSTS